MNEIEREVEEFVNKLISLGVMVGKYGGVAVIYLDKDDNVSMGYAIDERDFDELVEQVRSEVRFGDRDEIVREVENDLKELSA